MNTPLAQAKIDAIVRFIGSVALMFIGFLLARGPLAIAGVLAAFVGVHQAIRHFRRLTWVLAVEQQARAAGEAGGPAGAGRDPWQRTGGWTSGWRAVSLPRRVFALLYTVAEVDGQSGPREMDLVRRFLIERFLSPDVLADLTSWRAPKITREHLGPLVTSLRTELSYSECETVFWWCCMISLIDERFSRTEHDLLQDIADHFGMQSLHAARIFQHAKAKVLATTRGGQREDFGSRTYGGGTDGGRSSRYGSGGGRSSSSWGRSSSGRQRTSGPPADPAAARRHALQVLGLQAHADEQAIRKRHRELVKRYHPDAHASLGPVAAAEAAERFKEVQSAYETLTRS